MANQMLEMLHGVLYGKGLRFGKLSPDGRVIATMIGKHADRVPFMGPQIHDHAMAVAQVPAYKYYWDAELMVDVHLAVDRWYGFDSYTIVPDIYNFEVEALGAKMIYSDHAMPTVDIREPLIKKPADLDKLGSLDPSKGRIPMGVETARLICEKASGIAAMGFFCAPFSFICQAMGYPKTVRALRRDKVFARELFDFAENEAIFPYLKAQSEQPGVKKSTGADAWAAFPNLTPELVEEWVLPAANRLKAKVEKELPKFAADARPTPDYCEEDPAKFDKEIMFKCWSMMLKFNSMDMASTSMGRTQDWNMEWLQEFAVQHGKKGKKLPIIAALNGRFVRDSTPEQIVDKVREWIDIMGRDGRLVFIIGNVPADAPPVNIHTAIHAVQTLGRYPIAGNLSSIRVGPPAFQPFDEWLKGQPEASVILKGREPGPRPKVFA
ncbi:MAG: uroporphyrinogen decarboxylase family protein [Chloroflexota bacterium]|nr:uroporphyrinogen decarboxylase family protein [Chloroflexota bacterium]